MSVELTCTKCGAVNSFGHQVAGRMGQCGRCRTRLYIPRREEMREPGGFDAGRGSGGGGSGVVLLAIGSAVLVLLVLVGIGVGVFFFLRARNDGGNGADVSSSFGGAAKIKLSATGAARKNSRFHRDTDKDMFYFKAVKSGTMVATLHGDGRAGGLYVYQSDKKLHPDCKDGKRAQQALFQVTKGKKYYVKTSAPGKDGDYRLNLETVEDVGDNYDTALDVRLPVKGKVAQKWSIISIRDNDYFAVMAPGTGKLSVQMAPDDKSSLSCSLSAYREINVGNRLTRTFINSGARAGRKSTLELLVTEGDVYYVRARSNSSAPKNERTGAYRITFAMTGSTGGDRGTFATAKVLHLGDRLSKIENGRINNPSQAHYYQFSSPVNGKVRITFSLPIGSKIWTRLAAYDRNHLTVVADGERSSMTLFVIKGNTYYVKISGRNYGPDIGRTGDYRLTFRAESNAVKTTDKIGNSTASARTLSLFKGKATYYSRIDYIGDRDYFKIVPAKSGSITVEMKQSFSKLDCYLMVYERQFGGKTRFIASDDDSGIGLDSKVVFNANAGATYYIECKGFGFSTGSYALHITNAANAVKRTP